jgi:uncharacterized protein YjiS (DUF1127 family)
MDHCNRFFEWRRTMNVTLQMPQPATATRTLARRNRLLTWIKRKRAAARARRALAQVDARTLRDIGFTRRDIAVLTMVSSGR